MAKLIRKTFLGTVQKAEGDATPRIVFRASDSTPDRYGDRIFVSGMDLKAYEANPVLLWAHDHRQPAIGTAKVWVEGEGDSAVLYMEPTVSDVTPLGAQVKASVEAEIIRACSVGIRILDEKFEENDHGGFDFKLSELHEISLCNVPANPSAVRERAVEGEGEEPESTDSSADVLAKLEAIEAKLDQLQTAIDALTPKPEAEEPAEPEADPEEQKSLSSLARALASVLAK